MSSSYLEMVLKHFVLSTQYTEHKLNPSLQGRVILGKAQSDLILCDSNMVATSKRKFGISASFLPFLNIPFDLGLQRVDVSTM